MFSAIPLQVSIPLPDGNCRTHCTEVRVYPRRACRNTLFNRCRTHRFARRPKSSLSRRLDALLSPKRRLDVLTNPSFPLFTRSLTLPRPHSSLQDPAVAACDAPDPFLGGGDGRTCFARGRALRADSGAGAASTPCNSDAQTQVSQRGSGGRCRQSRRLRKLAQERFAGDAQVP